MNMKPAIVLRQLIKGREVTIGDRHHRIKENKLEYSTEEGVFPSKLSLSTFIQKCQDITDHDIAEITEEIRLDEKGGQNEKI